MKEDIFKQFEKISKHTLVDEVWLAANKRVLLAHMHLTATPARRMFLFRFAPAMVVAATLLALTGGMSLASQSTIPGDLLYPWKTGVVETIESAFIVGPQNRADFEVARTEKRLQEVTELAVRKTASPKVISKARERLEDQITVASATIKEAASEDTGKALDAAQKLGAVLAEHESALTTIEITTSTEEKPQVKEAISTIQEKTTNIQETIETLKIDAVQAQLETVWSKLILLDEKSIVRAEAELKAQYAQDALLNGDVEMAKKLIAETEDLFTQATPTPLPTLLPSITPATASGSLDSLQQAL